MTDTLRTPDDERVGAAELRAMTEESCRAALRVIADRESDVSLPELATAVYRRTAVESRERVMVTLHHIHLPKLDDADIVEYDPDGAPEERTVSEGVNSARARSLLDRASH